MYHTTSIEYIPKSIAVKEETTDVETTDSDTDETTTTTEDVTTSLIS
jgi:hypothetical protein